MRGHDAIVKARMLGYVPETVHVDFDVLLPNDGRHAHILIEPGDSIPLLDLRCLVGMTVYIHGDDPARVAQAITACSLAQAKRVISFCGEDMQCSS